MTKAAHIMEKLAISSKLYMKAVASRTKKLEEKAADKFLRHKKKLKGRKELKANMPEYLKGIKKKDPKAEKALLNLILDGPKNISVDVSKYAPSVRVNLDQYRLMARHPKHKKDTTTKLILKALKSKGHKI